MNKADFEKWYGEPARQMREEQHRFEDKLIAEILFGSPITQITKEQNE